jgi:hypothetical protein
MSNPALFAVKRVCWYPWGSQQRQTKYQPSGVLAETSLVVERVVPGSDVTHTLHPSHQVSMDEYFMSVHHTHQ